MHEGSLFDEMHHYERFARIRDRLFRQLTQQLTRWHITANMLTFVSFLSILAFPLFGLNSIAASILLLIHVTLDGLDGPLSRTAGTAHMGGMLLDRLNDYTGMVIVLVSLVAYSLLNPLLAIVYVYAYTLIAILVVIKHALGLPIFVTFRNFLLVYVLYFVWVCTGIDIFDEAIALFTILMLIPIMVSIASIYPALTQHHPPNK